MNITIIYMKNTTKNPLYGLFLALMLLQTGWLSAQCSPDILSPSIVCPADITTSVPAGTCSFTATLADPVYVDNCPGPVTLTSDLPIGNVFPLGQTAVTFTATDASGNSQTCSVVVSVNGGVVAPNCIEQDTVIADPSGVTLYNPSDLLESAPYNCSQILGSLTLNGTATPTVSLNGTGNPFVYVWVSAPGGIWNKCWGHVRILPACTNDQIAPVAVCDEFLTVQSNINGPNQTIVNGQIVDEGSYDNCTASPGLIFRADTVFSAQPPASPFVTFTGTGTFNLFMWVGDQSGNWTTCITEVSVIPPKCSPDVAAPTCVAPPDITITGEAYTALNINLQNLPQINTAFGSATFWDNCDNGNATLLEANSLLTYPNGDPKTLTRSFLVIDAAGNSSGVKEQIINISLPVGMIHFPAWHFPGDVNTDTVSYTFSVMAKSYTDLVFVAACNQEKSKTERTWSVIDWENYVFGTQAVALPALDLNNDGQIGDSYDVIQVSDSLWRLENGIPVQALVPATYLYTYTQLIRENYLDTATYHVTGTVFLDSLSNCAFDGGEPLLAGWKVKAIGQNSNRTYTAVSGANGMYDLKICPDDALVEISLDVPYNAAGTCNSTTNVAAGAVPVVVDLPVILSDTCAILGVDIATGNLRPCFAATYVVNYCNYSTDTVQNTYVDVALDTFISYTSSTIPGVLQSGNTYRFNTGDLAPGVCGQFNISVFLDCNTPLGLTHCTQANIYPNDECGYQGPLLLAGGYCSGDSVHLKITNVGLGNMPTTSEFVVAEDLIMYLNAPFQLNSGGVREITVPSNTSTWRIETPQLPGHPFGGLTAAAVEGCPTLGQPGLVNIYPLSDPDPFSAIDCTQNTSSFDPNDKQGFPAGYGADHYIRENTDIEYMIRFQNTGTDTAFNIVLLDTLSSFLDIMSVRPGAASHMYDFDIIDGNVMRFIFDNVLLPDSNVNEVASHGFVKFRVSQAVDNPMGTVIHNNASIYFDFNGPVVTNTTWHTIGKDFMEVNAVNPGAGIGKMLVYPNPSQGLFFLEMPAFNQHVLFELTDPLGRTVASQQFSGKTYRFEATSLPSGVYSFRVTGDNGAAYVGKIVVK